MSQRGRKSTQRERLLAGMVEVAVQEGYAGASVARVIAHAGVSRPTFYDYFDDRQACFLAAHIEHTDALVELVRGALTIAEPAQAFAATAEALTRFADTEPVVARFLMHEPVAAGGAALDSYDRMVDALGQALDETYTHVAADALLPDVVSAPLLGAVCTLISAGLRRGERELEGLASELSEWLAAYERPAERHRWRRAWSDQTPGSSPFVGSPIHPPPPLAAGHAALSTEAISQNHRERILFACIATSAEKSYAATTVADIVAAARVDRRVFYRHFRDKQDAFHATLEHGFQQSIAVTATAFFSAPAWPDRVWEAGLALSQFLAVNPKLARFAFVDAYTIGPSAVRRFEDLRAAYTIFLQEGMQLLRPGLPAPTPTALEAIAALIFQTIYQEIRAGRTAQLTAALPYITYLCLAPFLGIEEALRVIDAKLGQEHTSA